jgi:hypothetical protein
MTLIARCEICSTRPSTIKTAEPNSAVAFKDPCCNVKPRELENVAHLEDRLSQQLAYVSRAERAGSALFEAGEFLLLGCTKSIASFVILETVSVLKRLRQSNQIEIFNNGYSRCCITLLDPKKRSPSRLRLGDCAADPRSVAVKVTTECRSATLSMIHPLFSWCYNFNFTVKFSQMISRLLRLRCRGDGEK